MSICFTAVEWDIAHNNLQIKRIDLKSLYLKHFFSQFAYSVFFLRYRPSEPHYMQNNSNNCVGLGLPNKVRNNHYIASFKLFKPVAWLALGSFDFVTWIRLILYSFAEFPRKFGNLDKKKVLWHHGSAHWSPVIPITWSHWEEDIKKMEISVVQQFVTVTEKKKTTAEGQSQYEYSQFFASPHLCLLVLTGQDVDCV